MDRKSWIVTLASATALLSAVGYFAFRKYRAWKRTPIAVLDVDAVVTRSLPGRAAAQYLRTAKNILQRNIDEVRKLYSERENTPEAIKAINQAEAFAQQQTLIYQRKLDEEIEKIITSADLNRPGIQLLGHLEYFATMLQHMQQQNKGYAVIDGFPIPQQHVRVIALDFQPWEIVMASDGYPWLRHTLEETEALLLSQKTTDPLNIHHFKATKAFLPQNRSFDDRTYIRFKV